MRVWVGSAATTRSCGWRNRARQESVFLTGTGYNGFAPGNESYPVDGTAAGSNFRESSDMCFAADGKLHVIDYHLLRRYDPAAGTVRTWAYWSAIRRWHRERARCANPSLPHQRTPDIPCARTVPSSPSQLFAMPLAHAQTYVGGYGWQSPGDALLAQNLAEPAELPAATAATVGTGRDGGHACTGQSGHAGPGTAECECLGRRCASPRPRVALH